MILQALDSYYERLEKDPEAAVAPFGFSRQQIAFCITLNQDGSLHSIDDIRDQAGTKRVPKSMIVCGNAKPSGSGINPGFLWDNPAYVLGYKADDPKPTRTRESFEAFRQRHLDSEQVINDSEFSAVCRFLEAWNPADALRHQGLTDLGTGFGVFRIRAADHYVHERPAIKRWWKKQLSATTDDGESVVGQCLVTGEIGRLARLHEPKIKGVWGAQSAGAAIVSFNLDAFDSYGKKQSVNSPVSESAAFQYCTALNHLLRTGSKQRIQIGDASTVFWTERPSPAEGFLGMVFDPPTEDGALRTEIFSLLNHIANGEYPPELGSPATPFYVLGLSPNAARISVRFWLESTIGDVLTNLGQHFADLRIERSGDKDPEYPETWRLLRETARESKDIPPILIGGIMRSILTGAAYPQALYTSVLRRIHADRQLGYVRCAVLKAHLNRASRLGLNRLETQLETSLNPSRPESAYHIGRLFAAMEQLQKVAHPEAPSIRDRYLGGALASPSKIFSQAMNTSHHHLAKLLHRTELSHEERRKRRNFYTSIFADICHRIESFPSTHNLAEQGLAAIGYYHEQRWFYTPGDLKPNHLVKEIDGHD